MDPLLFSIRGISNASNPLFVVVPEFSTRQIVQTVPFINAFNVLHVILISNVEVSGADELKLTIFGLDGISPSPGEIRLNLNSPTTFDAIFCHGANNTGFLSDNVLYLTLCSFATIGAEEVVDFDFNVSNLGTAQDPPVISINGSGVVAYHLTNLTSISNESAFGITAGSSALYLVEPYFVVKKIKQDTVSYLQPNNITIVLQVNCDIPTSSFITITGLFQTNTPSNPSLAIVAPAPVFGSTADWDASGVLIISVVQDGMVRGSNYSIIVPLVNPLLGQDSPQVNISCIIDTSFAHAPIPSSSMDKELGNLAPLLINNFLYAYMEQSSPSSGGLNTLTVSLQARSALTVSESTKLTISGLTGSATPSTSSLGLVDSQNSGSTQVFGDHCEWINNLTSQALVLTVIADSEAGKVYSFSFNLTNGVAGQNEPTIQLWASGDSAPSATITTASSNNKRSLRIAKFNTKTLYQSTPVSGSLNTINLIFNVNVDLSIGDAVMTIGNLSGASASSPLTLYSGPVGSRADIRLWDGSTSQRGIWTTNTLTLIQRSNFLADFTYSLRFLVTNSEVAQEPPDVTVNVSGSIVFATVLADKTGQTIKGVVRGSDTLRILVPEFLTAVIAQSTCLSGATNFLSITLQTNINLEYVDRASITVTPLTGAKAQSPVTLLPETNGNSGELLFEDASGNLGYGLWGCTSCAFETLFLVVGNGLILQTGTEYALRAEIRNPRPDEWTLPQEYAPEGPVAISANGQFATFAPRVMLAAQESRDGIANGSLPLKIVVPEFVVRRVGQSSASQNASNTLTFTLQISVDVTRNSSIHISSMDGFLIDSSVVPISSPTNSSSDFLGSEIFSGSLNLDLFQTAGWDSSTSTLSLFFVNGSLANQTMIFSVSGRNQEQGQKARVLTISLSVEHGTFDSVIGPLDMLSDAGDAAPLLIAEFVYAASWQSNASPGAVNTITISFATSASLLQGGALFIAGLNGTDPENTMISTIYGNATGILVYDRFDPSLFILSLNITNTSIPGDVYEFSFSVNNSLQGQDPPTLLISARGPLNILPHELSRGSGNAATLLIARWLYAAISQNNSLAGEENFITIEFEVNVDLSSDAVISVSGLSDLGLSLYFPLLPDAMGRTGSQLLTGDEFSNVAGTGSYKSGDLVFHVRRGQGVQARTRYSISFKVVNPSAQSQAQNVTIQVTGTLSIPKQTMDVSATVSYQPGFVNKVSSPLFSPSAPLTCIDRCLLSISSRTQGSTVYYTLDDTLPTNASSLYSGPFYVSSLTRLRAIAFKDGLETSDVSNSSIFSVQASSPIFVPSTPNNCSNVCEVAVFCPTAQSSVFYRTLTVANLDAGFLPYSSPILALPNSTIESFCNKSGLLQSPSSYWPRVPYDFAQASRQLGSYVNAICASTSLVHGDGPLETATAGDLLRFFIVANDERGKLVDVVFEDSLPWNISMYPKNYELIPTVRGRVSYPLKGLTRPFETIVAGGAYTATAGYFVGTIAPILTGVHKVYVQLGSRDILGSPFLVTVLPALAVCGSRSTLVGYGLTFAALTPYRNTFFIEARDQFGNVRPGRLPDNNLFSAFIVRTQFAYQQSPDCNQTSCDGCSPLEIASCSYYAPPFLGYSAGGLSPPWRSAISTLQVKVLPQLQEPSSSLGSCLTADQSEREVLTELEGGVHSCFYHLNKDTAPCQNFQFLHTRLLEMGSVHATYYIRLSCLVLRFVLIEISSDEAVEAALRPMPSVPNEAKTLTQFGVSQLNDSLLTVISNETASNQTFVIRLHGMMMMKRKTSFTKSFRWSNISSSDRVKVWIDNSLVIDEWSSLSSVQPAAYLKFFDLSFPYDVFIQYKISSPSSNTSAELQLSDAAEELRNCERCAGLRHVLSQVCLGGRFSIAGVCVNYTGCNCSNSGELFCQGAAAAQDGTCSCLAPNTGASCAGNEDCTGAGECIATFESFASYRIFAPYELVGSPFRLHSSPKVSSARCVQQLASRGLT
eukprot:218330-Hanusia_phi.AAC.2